MMLAITMSIDPLMYPASQTSARGLPQPRKSQSTPTVVEVSQASQAKRPMLSASIIITEITPSRHMCRGWTPRMREDVGLYLGRTLTRNMNIALNYIRSRNFRQQKIYET
jgi:hypothetical protein